MAEKEYIIIPMDRLGVAGAQKDIVGTIKFINTLIDAGKEVFWLVRPVRIFTDDFPEGHIYSPGGFIIKGEPEICEQLKNNEIVYSFITSNLEMPVKINRKKIALYTGKGAADFCTKPLIEVLELTGFKHECLNDKDIRSGLLKEFDIFLVPGGPDAGESFYWGLGDLGYKNIKEFVYDKGSYFGICAGAYLPLKSLSEDNRYWLNLIEATDDQELDYWRTGTGFVRVRVVENMHPFAFGVATGSVNTFDIVYWEGPAIKILRDSVKILARFDDFIASGTNTDYPRWNLLDNTPAKDSIDNWYNILTRERFNKYLKDNAAVVETKINGNKMLLYSPHAEFGNIGITQRKNSQVFQLITNGLFYLSI
ncbi:BPL-N domain-containing protein [Thermoanaerobacterium sp. DL9XJH110]|uniref:BPL-N domain-containing protein n=1 Tax=Thermoanaerobacterium sp. DL9XJH110 TaxID=3386643 RepID=UPI003BB52087